MRILAFIAIVISSAVTATLHLDRGFTQGPAGEDIIPNMDLEQDLDLEVFIETVNEEHLATEIEGYLDGGAVCMMLSTALETEYGNGDRLYYGCAAFLGGSDWDALKWDYNYEISSGANPTIPDDSLVYRTVADPTGTEGLGPILSDRLSWDYLVHVCNNCPIELFDELSAKDLKKVWVEHQTGSPELVESFWKYEGSGQSKTYRVWSTVTGGQFGSINVD